MHWLYRIKEFGDRELFYKELYDTTSWLATNDRQVIIVAGTPSFNFEAEVCKWTKLPLNYNKCSQKNPSLHEEYLKHLSSLQKLSRSDNNISVVTLNDAFFFDGSYSMVVDGDLLFRDSNHLNLAGSDFVAAAILEQFAPQPRAK